MIAACLLSMLATAPSREEVLDIVRRAEMAWAEERWDAASRGFADAYAVDPDPAYLFARAQAERFAGRCNVALQIWDRYLEVERSQSSRQEAKVMRAYCEPGSAPASPTKAVPGDDAPVTGAAPGEQQRPRPWYRDPAGGVLVATGGVSAVIGGSILGLALSRDRDARNAETEGSYVDEKDAVRRPHGAGIAVLSVGGALLVAGVVRWAVVAGRASKPGRGLGQSWGTGAQRVTWQLGARRRFAALSLGLRF